MQRRLAFDRGLIFLVDDSGRHLVYSAGYGYDENEKKHLQSTNFQLDHPDSKGVFVRAFLDQKHIAVNNIRDIEETLSAKSQKLARNLGVRSLLCVPIVFENRSLGILAVDNVHSMTPLKKSDVLLLQGIASHIAISINNSGSFQKLRQSETKYRQTLECIPEGYYELDRTNAIIFANNALCELLDCSFDGRIGRRFDDFFSPDDRHQIDELFKSIQKDGHTVRFAPFMMARITGDLIAVDLSVSLVCDTNGQPTGFRGLIRDATDRLNMENEKMILENKLLQSQKMEAIGTLAGGIAHNFNNWLSGILGNITLIRMDSPQNGKINERVAKIEGIIESAARMTRQLLGYARAGKYKVDLIDVNRVIKESADTFSITRKDIAIQLRLDPKIAAVKADKGQVEQVLWNLYANAVDAMPGGGKLFIETRQMPSDTLQDLEYEITPGDYVCFSISDSGMGIEPEHCKSIFEPFFTTKNGTGTGLGLASVYGIVKSHGGYVDVKSCKGQGSTFSIFLPAAKEVYIANQQSYDPATSGGREKILLVDDEDMILDTCSRLLSNLGYETLTALTGKEALDIYARHANSIDLVIIDMIMPDMTGRDLFDRLKEKNPRIKTLLSSGYSLNEQAQNILDRGCDGFIQKPYNITQLSEIIRIIINSSGS